MFKVNKSRTKTKLEFSPAYFQYNIFFKILPLKCKRRKFFDTWCYIVICATIFSIKSNVTNVFPEHILKSKACDQAIKILQYAQETSVLEFQASRNIAKFLRLPILKKSCERPLLDCFNGSLSHRPNKGSRSILYDKVRLQGPSHRLRFLRLFTIVSWGILPSTDLVDCADNNYCSVFSFSLFSRFLYSGI